MVGGGGVDLAVGRFARVTDEKCIPANSHKTTRYPFKQILTWAFGYTLGITNEGITNILPV